MDAIKDENHLSARAGCRGTPGVCCCCSRVAAQMCLCLLEPQTCCLSVWKHTQGRRCSGVMEGRALYTFKVTVNKCLWNTKKRERERPHVQKEWKHSCKGKRHRATHVQLIQSVLFRLCLFTAALVLRCFKDFNWRQNPNEQAGRSCTGTKAGKRTEEPDDGTQ